MSLEVAAFILTVMRLERQADPEYSTTLTELRNLETHEQICKASRLNRKTTTRINLALFHGLLPKLREGYGFREMLAFTRAFRREDCHHNDHLPLPFIRPIEYSIDDTEVEYQGVGERVELSTFCKPAELVPKDTECSVYVTVIDGSERDEAEQPVLTKCGHTFHKLCLDKWVSDSRMKVSNTCPLCRTVLCKHRKRLHTSLEAISVVRSHGVDGIPSADSSSIESLQLVVATPPRERVQWLEARVTAHLQLITAATEGDNASDTDESGRASIDSDEAMAPREMFEILRAERAARMRVVNC
ncbi:hypothetical protein BU25DRAFT_421886 [Macroventuria anomochaeta]|uniref:Uncharacterized protein n=1 Tax=Macroventuria anomochaeta TaxID=301207 RepID=A0ACB6S268_9PLEO|nr:uncharacterized protein BU25DRAFT_421886 [Macroventuria anomochaeta]KAF2627479.1 hypothetical protein BU25DRAFT_421886 [Macroventuria anomochaeta]